MEYYEEQDVSARRKEEESLLKRVIRTAIVLLMITGLVYFSGVYQYLFYQRTPSTVVQPVLEQEIEGEVITVPLSFVVFTSDELGGSERTKGDIRRLVENASRIWNQAGIKLELGGFERIFLESNELASLRRDPVRYLRTVQNQAPASISVFLVHNLAGINGIAYGGLNTVALADHTSAFDFRVLAHEVGHVLGLEHVENPQRLMDSGAAGVDLTLKEINIVRNTARQF